MPHPLIPRRHYEIPLAHGGALRLGDRTLIMGVLNVTPDSFSDGGKYVDVDRAVEAAVAIEAAGADILDVGGESTRPGATPVEADVELQRVAPVIAAAATRVRIPISIDTYKAVVAAAALDAGASIVNDVSGLRYDADLASLVAARRAGYVLLHNRGRSRHMYGAAVYDDPAADVVRELGESLARAESSGIARDAIVLDPGLGFAKRAEQSWDVLRGLSALATLERPLLVGASRKSFLTALEGVVSMEAREWAGAAATTAAVLLGAHIVRVHAVREMVPVVRAADRIAFGQTRA